MARFYPADEGYMRRALALARRGEGRVEPNPMVGCVLVRGGHVIGEGFHRRFGGPHAEVDALQCATTDPRGCTAYVTLEPCNYHGKTPPCTDALVAARVARVVACVRDPNPRVSGRGLTLLRKQGITVAEGLLVEDGRELLAPYLKLVSTGLPWVTLKWGQSLDGKLATRTGNAQWITDDTQRAHANRQRGRCDAIIVGIGTVLSDNPQLTCRSAHPRRIATRVVLDTHLRTPASARLVRTAKKTPTWIFCGPGASSTRRAQLERRGCRVIVARVGRAVAPHVDPAAVLRTLGAEHMTNAMIEGGGTLLGAFYDAGLADELHIYIAPLLIGGRTAIGALHGEGPAKLTHLPRLHANHLRRLGAGWVLQSRLNAPKA